MLNLNRIKSKYTTEGITIDNMMIVYDDDIIIVDVNGKQRYFAYLFETVLKTLCSS